MRLTGLPRRFAAMPARVQALPKRAEGFYASREWRSLVARLKRERGSWCAKCGAGGRIIGDHIRERRDGGAELDPANIELLCQPCHNRKTAKARKLRVEGHADGVRPKG